MSFTSLILNAAEVVQPAPRIAWRFNGFPVELQAVAISLLFAKQTPTALPFLLMASASALVAPGKSPNTVTAPESDYSTASLPELPTEWPVLLSAKAIAEVVGEGSSSNVSTPEGDQYTALYSPGVKVCPTAAPLALIASSVLLWSRVDQRIYPLFDHSVALP